MQARFHAGFATLPSGTGSLFAAGAEHGFFLSEAWFRLVCEHAMPPGSTARFLVATDHQEKPTALLALRVDANGALVGLSTPYTCRFAPLLRDDDIAAGATALARRLRSVPSVRLDALDPSDPATMALIAAARAAGLRPLRFAHFGNWHEPVGGLSWDAYLAARPGPLRSTVRRKFARMARDGGSASIVTGGAELEAAIGAYEAVYARSWKEPEPFPAFNAALMRVLAAMGKLRLGIYRLAGSAVAAQLWLVEQRRASVLKLAHDSTHRDASPGTVLTAIMLRHLLANEQVDEIDFGRGDDDYKRLWATRRRQMVGVVLANPLRPSGLLTIGRHGIGGLWRRLRPAPGI